MEVVEREVKVLVPESGKAPFDIWLAGIRDQKTRQRIQARLTRLQNGNFGDFQSVGKEVFELRIFFGPGYRIYFALAGDVMIVLLGGGDKGTQSKDIEAAQMLWQEYKDATERYQRNFR
ncbi:MAG: type II toxin-antitoxin system RelE/ParE family toxin [Armatimonadetes bacterium]|nr:type II toxin-antitoxin system RelE/ParE family toxin [Armatimonadota bacterium]